MPSLDDDFLLYFSALTQLRLHTAESAMLRLSAAAAGAAAAATRRR